MKHTVTLSKDKSILIFKVKEDFNLKAGFQFTIEAMKVVESYGINKILFDIRGHNSLTSFADKYNFANRDSKLSGLNTSIIIALLVEEINDGISFIETAMCNSGYRYKAHINKAEAINWLKEQ